MAKITRSVSFKSAVIDMGDRTITEITKDDSRVYSLDKLFSEWSGIEGISLSIRLDDEMPEDGE